MNQLFVELWKKELWVIRVFSLINGIICVAVQNQSKNKPAT